MDTEKNVVLFLTQNNKLCNQLQSSIPSKVVIKVDNIEAINNSVKHNPVGAVVLHVTNSASWIIFDMLRSGYPHIPRFAILAPSFTGSEDETRGLANRYGATAIISEKSGVSSLSTLIVGDLNHKKEEQPTGKENFLALYGEVSREMERLQKEFTILGMRTLPQPDIGTDTKVKLKRVLNKLQAIKIEP